MPITDTTKQKPELECRIEYFYRRTFKDNSNDLVIAGNYAYSNRNSTPIYTQKTIDINNSEAGNTVYCNVIPMTILRTRICAGRLYTAV